MPSQLDILALEPFYGGERRVMLETVIRCSRHRWTLLKLPPRRIERRLAAAANWFAEQLSRHWKGHVDVLFVSEAINLATLLRLAPELANLPSVVYFHDNQLPDAPTSRAGPFDLVNLSTAVAASEIWFNSTFHLDRFMLLAGKLVDVHPEILGRSPIRELTAKARVIRPPLDLNLIDHVKRTRTEPRRDPRAIFVETRGADLNLLNAALELLTSQKESFRLITVGPVENLSERWQRRTIAERDDAGQVSGMLEAGIFASAKQNPVADYLAVRALLAGCCPVLPDAGVYRELLPDIFHASCLCELQPSALAESLRRAMISEDPWDAPDFSHHLADFEAIGASRVIDESFERIATKHRAPATKLRLRKSRSK